MYRNSNYAESTTRMNCSAITRIMTFWTIVLSSPSQWSSSRDCTPHGTLHMNIKALCSVETSVAF